MAQTDIRVEPLTPDRFADLDALFGTNKTTAGCRCMWFLAPVKDVHTGWGEVNRERFEACAGGFAEPAGVLAYRDGEPVGWCAVGPRTRYERMLRSRVLRERDAAEDASVWLVTCFFVRTKHRRQGVTRALLAHAAELARAHGATAIEGFPLAGERRRSVGEAFVGVEPLFAACGYTAVARPTPARVVMRRELTPRSGSRSGSRRGSARVG